MDLIDSILPGLEMTHFTDTMKAAPEENPVRLIELAQKAVEAIDALQRDATARVRKRVSSGGELSSNLIDREQHAVHGLAWIATYARCVSEMTAYAQRLHAESRLGVVEDLLTRIGLGEYLAQIFGGIAMSQVEIIRPADFDLNAARIAECQNEPVAALVENGNTARNRARLIGSIGSVDANLTVGDSGLDDTMEVIRGEMRRFADAQVIPQAHGWHRKNAYIPMEIIDRLADLGVFGLTIPEEFGGMGLGKVAMCVVTEELSRAYIGVGSLGTRSEIAAELILCGGTDAQKRKYLPKIASGEILPTAVFTEPNTGSDLASLRTRAMRAGDAYRITGSKTWITHPVRANLMTLLARTDPTEPWL